MDIWVAINPRNTSRLVSVLKEIGFDFPDVTSELFLEQNKGVRMGSPPVRIKLITSISGVFFETSYMEREQDNIDEVEANLINLPNLKINKRASGRHKDLTYLEHLP